MSADNHESQSRSSARKGPSEVSDVDGKGRNGSKFVDWLLGSVRLRAFILFDFIDSPDLGDAPSNPTRFRLILLCIALGALTGASLDSAESVFLTTALRRNLTQRADSLDWISSKEALSGSRAALEPMMDVTASAQTVRPPGGVHDDDLQLGATASQWVPGGGTAAISLEESAYRWDPALVPPPAENMDTSTLTISFRQPLLRGFGDGDPVVYQLRQARAAERLQFHTSRGDGLALLQQARTAWWSLLALRAQVRALEEDSVAQQLNLQIVRIRFRTGASSRLDTLTAHQTWGKSRLALLQSEEAEKEGLRILETVADTAVVAIPTPDTLPPTDSSAFPPVDELVHDAKLHAPQLAQALDLVTAKESETDYRRSARLPQLDGTVFASSGLPAGNPFREWSIGARINLDWSIPAGAERARYRQALVDLNSAKVRSVAAVSEVRHQIERIVEAHLAAQEEILVAVDLARVERVRLTSVQEAAKIGSQSLTDLDVARTDWLNAVNAAWQAFSGAKSLEAELETWTGIGPTRRGWVWEEK